MKNKLRYITTTLLLNAFTAQAQTGPIDIASYHASIEPDITHHSIKASVTIFYNVQKAALQQIILDAGALEIDSVVNDTTRLHFEKKNKQLIIQLAKAMAAGEKSSLTISYHGTPKAGLVFPAGGSQVHTAFSTSQWMPCVDAPSDKASFYLDLILPSSLKVVANGTFTGSKAATDGKLVTSWQQTNPQSSYLFGFAAGLYNETTQTYNGITLRNLATPKFSVTRLKQVFATTAGMLQFYEMVSGVPYPDKTYTQVLAPGNTQQEMSSFTVMNEAYGEEVLEDKEAVWLSAHEMAHQWWGNGVTNDSWSHFWLNEGLTNFMVAAYFERYFGKARYKEQIQEYRTKYQAVKAKGADKPLVFPNWNNPSTDDRILVYNKGAYVIHLLRETLGELMFWKAIKCYTREYWGKTVTTQDFQHSLETSTGRDLVAFFQKWIYYNPLHQ
ncbi:MAG: M1 family metallopeptidase [Chitinophagaceae bacterium]